VNYLAIAPSVLLHH